MDHAPHSAGAKAWQSVLSDHSVRVNALFRHSRTKSLTSAPSVKKIKAHSSVYLWLNSSSGPTTLPYPRRQVTIQRLERDTIQSVSAICCGQSHCLRRSMSNH